LEGEHALTGVLCLVQIPTAAITTLLKEHLFDLEREHGKEGQAIYILYPDESGKWRIQAVPASPESFESRKPLPELWRGLRDEELAKVTGVPGTVFVHASGFIGGRQSCWHSFGVSQWAGLMIL